MRARVDYYQDELDYMYCLAMRGAPEQSDAARVSVGMYLRPAGHCRQFESHFEIYIQGNDWRIWA